MNDVRIDIAQTVYRFAYGIDQSDWVAYRDIFVAPPAAIEFDYSSYSAQPASSMNVDTWLGRVDHLVLGDDGRWRIDAVQLTVWWRRGDDSIMKLARERGNLT